MTAITNLFPEESPITAIAREVRGHAAARDLRQEDIGKALGLTQGRVSERMRGKTPFTVMELYALASLFGIRVADLMPQTTAAGASAGEAPAGARWAIRDLNPEPAGLESVPVGDGDLISVTLADVIPLSPRRIRRSEEKRRPNGPEVTPQFAPEPVHGVVAL